MAQAYLIANAKRRPCFKTFSDTITPPMAMNSHQSSNNLECRVCEDSFSLGGNKVPRLLLCGHTLCHACLGRLHTSAPTILCPFDRQPTEIVLHKQTELGVACDEEESHVALIYCTVCTSHLCLDCSERTHATKTLSKHKRVPLSEKPREKPKCLEHWSHPIEFVCIEEGCSTAPLMCFICKDYKHTKHKHVLLEKEAHRIRYRLSAGMQYTKRITIALTETAAKLEAVARQLGTSEASDATVLDVHTMAQDNPEGDPITDVSEGTGPQARHRVRQYFEQLRYLLNQQEAIAMTALDTHIRERLCSIRQQQEDLANILSQMISVVVDSERLLQQDDGRLVISSEDVVTRIMNLSSQQAQLADIIALNPDPAITITFTKDNRIHIGARIEMRVVTLGLDGAGKTTILFKLKNDECMQTSPTIGFNVETIEYKNIKFTIWDVGGQSKLRPLWRHYYYNTQAVIFVIDVSCQQRFEEAKSELSKLMNERELKEASLLIFANRMIPHYHHTANLAEDLGLAGLCIGRSWHLQPCDALSGFGLQSGLDWLTQQLAPNEILNESN